MKRQLIKCNPAGCEMRKKCYRYCQKPDLSTSYINYEYTCNRESGFDMFVPIPKST